jgi:hypothetical protein
MKRMWKSILGCFLVLSILFIPVYSISQDINSSINPFELVKWEVKSSKAVIVEFRHNGDTKLIPTVFRHHVNPNEDASIKKVMGIYMNDKLIQYNYCEEGKVKAYLYRKEFSTYKEVPVTKKEANKCIKCHNFFKKEIPECLKKEAEKEEKIGI